MIARTLALCCLAAPAAAPSAAQDAAGDAASRLSAAYDGLTVCGYDSSDERHEIHAVSVEVPWQDEPAALSVGLFLCNLGAYNVDHVVLIDDGWEAAPAPLPEMRVEGVFADEMQEELTGVEVTGMGATIHVTNGTFDPQALTLTREARYRGLGDASGHAEWRLDGLGFVLVRQWEDLSYDGETNPWLVAEEGMPVAPRPMPAE